MHMSLIPLPAPPPETACAPWRARSHPDSQARKRRALDTTAGLVSVTAIAWGRLGGQPS